MKSKINISIFLNCTFIVILSVINVIYNDIFSLLGIIILLLFLNNSCRLKENRKLEECK